MTQKKSRERKKYYERGVLLLSLTQQKFMIFCYDTKKKVESVKNITQQKFKKPWSAGFEPARAKPTWFLVMPDNHSGTTTLVFQSYISLYKSITKLFHT